MPKDPVETAPQPTRLPPAVNALIDARWPAGGDAWQQRQASEAREAFKAELTIILKES